MSLKLHINLAVALILLNLHFLLMEQVSSMVSSGACIYVGLLLHYSLLATFSWMAIEGFHLYLLLVRIFNIYISRYLLKLCLVGWGELTTDNKRDGVTRIQHQCFYQIMKYVYMYMCVCQAFLLS